MKVTLFSSGFKFKQAFRRTPSVHSMELDAFPFTNQEEFSNLYSLLRDMENPIFDGGNKKRGRKNEDEASNFTDLLSSSLFLDDDSNPEQFQSGSEFQCFPQFEVGQNQKSNKRARQSESVAADRSGGATAGKRRLWVKNRSTDWWNRLNAADFPEDEFKRAFRMSKATFNVICEDLHSTLVKKNTALRAPIPVRQRVAVCVWRLATGEPLRLVSTRFGLGISTCHKLVLEVCSAIRTVLRPKYLQWPDENKLRTVKTRFKSISGIPDVAGSIYTTHIPIIAPKDSAASFFNQHLTERNQKTSYSISVQGVVDPAGVFTDVFIGCPGSMPDDQVLQNSGLFQRAHQGLLKDTWVVGPSGFPLTDWVLAPYAHQKTWAQDAFNKKLGEVEVVAKEAFSRLKGRWACLQRRSEVKLQDLPDVLEACCVLHNICETRNEVMEAELQFEVFDDEVAPENCVWSLRSAQARDQIAHDLLHHGHVGTG